MCQECAKKAAPASVTSTDEGLPQPRIRGTQLWVLHALEILPASTRLVPLSLSPAAGSIRPLQASRTDQGVSHESIPYFILDPDH